MSTRGLYCGFVGVLDRVATLGTLFLPRDVLGAQARRRMAGGAVFAPLRVSVGVDGGARVHAHGNFTFSGDNADRHTAEAMGAVLDQVSGQANVSRQANVMCARIF